MHAIFALIRPKHWIKNILVFAPFFFALQVTQPSVILPIFIGFISFSLIASAIYVINDICDAPADRKHPEKKHRPIASGIISQPQAIVIATVLVLLSILSALSLPLEAQVSLAVYGCMNLAYSLWLKRLLLIDVMIIATGFVLRLFVGGSTADVTVSNWIIVCVFFGALFLGFGKRKNEVLTLSEKSSQHRLALEYYTPDFLNQLIGLTAVSSIIGYTVYAIERDQANPAAHVVYTIPFVVYGIFRYFHVIYNKQTSGDPTNIFLIDRGIQLAICLWLLSFLVTSTLI
jgi:decaprenyl-phosphate phosphoribosyltransferase